MKKIISLILVMLIVFSLIGCKSKGNISADEEIAFTAGEESQVDITPQNQKTEENKESEKEEQKDTVKETVKIPDDTTDKSAEITDSTGAEQNFESKDENEIVNQVALDTPTMCEGMVYEDFSFNSISDMIHTIKTHEYVMSDEERKYMEECFSTLTDKQLAAEYTLRSGTKDDIRFENFNIDGIEYFYKIKDIPGYTITIVALDKKQIQFVYVPVGKEIITEEDKIHVTYIRNEHFVTDSYFDDYMEYYKIREKTEKVLDKNDSVGGFLYGDDFLYTKREHRNYAFMRFAVENTMIEIIGNGDMANYDALKKLCVAEKVVVK